MALRNRIVGSGEEPPDQLVANPLNWRIHPQAQQKALRGSLETVGWVQQVLVNKRIAPPDPKTGLTDPDDVPELGEETHIKRGDLFVLGDHRLMCGDSTDAGDVGRLMDGLEPAMLLTDPPYGLDRNLARARGRAWRLENDNPSDARVMYEALKAAWAAPERYVWGQWNTWAHLVDALGDPDNCIVWVKSNMGMGHGYRHQHEFLAYYGRRSFSGQSDVWESPRDYSGLHPTIKPVALLARAIENSSSPTDGVLDLFVGSGSTIIAAEQTGRRCYAMEIDPRYVAVAIERWEKFTGRTSERVDG